MSRLNLLNEPWIEVISMNEGTQREISLLELFHHAEQYRCLAGEMETQNFAVLRFLLAVVQTVFSRYDSDGNPYPFVELNDQMQQIGEVDEDDRDDYVEAREESWQALWKAGHFPEIVCQYLEKWQEHFFLFDETYPFYQITAEEMSKIIPDGKKPTEFSGRNLNRLISESGNKTALFSPVSAEKKDFMSASELARWLLMLQGYIGLSDKTSIVGKMQKPSKGWIFDIGGLYLKGDNLFETIMLNFIPVHPEPKYRLNGQKPCWENSGLRNVERLKSGKSVDNLAELYTNWSRAVYINPNMKNDEPVLLNIVKLPAIEHQDNFLEPMTIWSMNSTGDNKGHYTPRKHRPDQAVWRSFGLIALKTSSQSDQKQPAIIERIDEIRKIVGSKWIDIQAVSMKDDGNATSWVPVDEIIDNLNANDLVIADASDNGWIVRINNAVETTKQTVEIYREFVQDTAEIRGKDPRKDGKAFIDSEKENLYQNLNEPFRTWLSHIQPEDSKNEKVSEWYDSLKNIVMQQAESIVNRATTRDFIGIEKGDQIFNIVNAYQKFKNRVMQKLLR
ncbi:MAG: type I-E CRISPR-associated protein Cse1/CasA [Lachnospiraceae bacterium]|jgi:CRISPR system Cascade subunit CasA|nr:type I-E CRISPR-associated protein Cse1/CasA [Lachnospiraceae bacterium]MCH4029929.1 type I-E CRISPR-associated protein Cse1/CasA [Lachnospiraceae bacterium]MCH4070410.1 type I-E CRISPR-associated protein Cse1/CasA [Lachnospiraceae bacterium]MCI1331637.1 type I-E CRISPR-associated protein Cse1/CasA [Lachnospiraceae bacterium]MCI1401524.1 type I-E CRISPR-associated protein Cse1/CasA [Lachnospiraceae bacterium]